jgi:hypothetical protein
MEAIIYETVVLELPVETTDLFMQTFHARPPTFFAKTVKRLYITGILSFSDARALLAACTGATDITCWIYPHTFTAHLLPHLPTPALRRLSIPLEALWGMAPVSIQFTPALFPRLSHLEIVNPPGGHPALTIDWAGLAALPALTHVALGELCFGDHAHFIPLLGVLLDACPGLEVLVIITRDELFKDELCKSGLDEDERVVVQSDFNGALMVHEYWEGVRKGGPDFWAMADRAVRCSVCFLSYFGELKGTDWVL